MVKQIDNSQVLCHKRIITNIKRISIKVIKKLNSKEPVKNKLRELYKEKKLAIDFKCDLLVENNIVIELKSVSEITPIHKAQLLTYMKLLNVPKGILINFNCFNIFKEGQMTFVNEIFHQLPKH